ncbi:hypothetical protein JCM11491_001189 [Sporobolomyces phaffii]
MPSSAEAPSTSFTSSTPPEASFSTLSPSELTLESLERVLPALNASGEVEEQLRNLASYRTPVEAEGQPRLSEIPRNRLASVLVLLHLSRDGRRLCATLTTRSQKLRSHPGETALPGGKFEPLEDRSIEQTALREANEEISLPLPAPTQTNSSTPASDHLLHLTNLSPYTSRTLLLVVPCIYLLLLPPDEASDWLARELEPSPEEVDAIFTCDLTDLLLLPESAPPSSRDRDPYVYSHTDYSWPLSPTTTYRLHSFSSPSFGSSITGLTADILIDTASIAVFGAQRGLDEQERLGYERRAEGQASWREICERALRIERGKKDPGRGVEVANGNATREVGLGEKR